jgi:hypothetical protein
VVIARIDRDWRRMSVLFLQRAAGASQTTRRQHYAMWTLIALPKNE